MIRRAGALLFCLMLGACGEAPKKNNMQLQKEADGPLLQDIERAGVELERRLSERVRLRDGIVLVQEPPPLGNYYSYVLSQNAPWVVTCGIGGLSVVLGNSVSAVPSVGGVGNDIELQLTFATIDQKDCAALGPRIGKRLKAMFRNEQPAR